MLDYDLCSPQFWDMDFEVKNMEAHLFPYDQIRNDGLRDYYLYVWDDGDDMAQYARIVYPVLCEYG